MSPRQRWPRNGSTDKASASLACKHLAAERQRDGADVQVGQAVHTGAHLLVGARESQLATEDHGTPGVAQVEGAVAPALHPEHADELVRAELGGDRDEHAGLGRLPRVKDLHLVGSNSSSHSRTSAVTLSVRRPDALIQFNTMRCDSILDLVGLDHVHVVARALGELLVHIRCRFCGFKRMARQ